MTTEEKQRILDMLADPEHEPLFKAVLEMDDAVQMTAIIKVQTEKLHFAAFEKWTQFKALAEMDEEAAAQGKLPF